MTTKRIQLDILGAEQALGPGVLVLNDEPIAANTALAGVLIGTPVTPALPANSIILSSLAASGDILVTAKRNGNSVAILSYDSSAEALNLGASTFTEGSPAVKMTTSNASVDGGTSAEPFLLSNTQTGIGGVGGRARFYMTTNVALGGWSNALKAEVVYGTSGKTTGLGSAFVGELKLSAGTTSGSYAALEAELVAESGAKAGTATSFLYMDASDAATVINSAAGYLFEIGAGVTDTAGGIFESESVTGADFTHVLKCRIRGVAYYIGLNTAKTF